MLKNTSKCNCLKDYRTQKDFSLCMCFKGGGLVTNKTNMTENAKN